MNVVLRIVDISSNHVKPQQANSFWSTDTDVQNVKLVLYNQYLLIYHEMLLSLNTIITVLLASLSSPMFVCVIL